MVFEDRISKYPGRWTLVREDGLSEIVTLVRNDEPIKDGTPINASTLNELSTVAGAINAKRKPFRRQIPLRKNVQKQNRLQKCRKRRFCNCKSRLRKCSFVCCCCQDKRNQFKAFGISVCYLFAGHKRILLSRSAPSPSVHRGGTPRRKL